jgi:hypothetical protein
MNDHPASSDPQTRTAAARLAALPDPEGLAERIRAAVDRWPPLTDAQRDRLALLITPRGEVVMPDAGGWVSGPGLDPAVLADALADPCPLHQVAAGEPCPLVLACLTRCGITPDVR